jgi:hypothetical protein
MNICITTESRISSRSCGSVNKYMKNRAPQGRRLEDKRLEIVESADVVLHVARYWAAVEDIPERTEE